MNDSVSDAYDYAHDPLCPVCRATDGLCNSNCASCLCYLIAKVREDERSKDLDYAYVAAHAEADGQRDMLAKCIAAVEACGDDKGYIYSDTETGIEWAIAALRALHKGDE